MTKNIYRDSERKAPSQFRYEAEGWDMCLDTLKSNGVKINEHTWQSDLVIQVFRLITDPITKKIKHGTLCFIEDDAKPTMTASPACPQLAGTGSLNSTGGCK